jgi:hypothetical protein
MALDKEQLTALAGMLEFEGRLDKHLADYDSSIAFFSNTIKTLEAARFRLLIGGAAFVLRRKQPMSSKRTARLAPIKFGRWRGLDCSG